MFSCKVGFPYGLLSKLKQNVIIFLKKCLTCRKEEREIKYDLHNTGSSNQNIKVKVKLSLCLTKHHAMKAYWGSEGIAPLIL
jgi:hypothetical protein